MTVSTDTGFIFNQILKFQKLIDYITYFIFTLISHEVPIHYTEFGHLYMQWVTLITDESYSSYNIGMSALYTIYNCFCGYQNTQLDQEELCGFVLTINYCFCQVKLYTTHSTTSFCINHHHIIILQILF